MSGGARAKAVSQGYYALEGIRPADGERWSVLLSREKADWMLRYRSQGQIEEMIRLVPKALLMPTAIFKGLRDRAEKDWLCYCFVPDRAYHPSGTPKPPYEREVFLVFVSVEGDRRVAYLWYWHEADPGDPGLPLGHADRFGRRVL